MCRRFVLALAVAMLGCHCGAQSPSTPAQPTRPPATEASSADSVLGVVVEDKGGHPVRGLKPQNFRVTEGGIPQTILRMEEHSSLDAPKAAPPFPSLPPGTFTDYTPMAPGETLNVLVVDGLNTPLKGEGFLRSQLLQYARNANPNARVAIFGLANHLILLQGFTSNPSALSGVLERKLIARVPASGISSPSSPQSPTIQGGPWVINLAANLRLFESQLGSLETDFRVPYTLDAFNTLAHYLASFPGRKNLIWFSASFPFNIVPDPSLHHPFDVSGIDEAELRETVDLFSKAQVAVYPVDARSLITQSANDKVGGNTSYASSDHRHEPGKMPQTEAAEHAVMEAIATNTGGRAVYNPASLADAVNHIVTAGSNYYSLTYRSSAAATAVSYRPIEVEVTGSDAGQPLQLSYRRGNLAGDAQSRSSDRVASYGHAALRRGGPTPEDLLFRVRVSPASTTTETTIAPNNQLASVFVPNEPLRRYNVDFLALPGELTFTAQSDGRSMAKADFLVHVYDIQGDLLDESGRTVTLEPKTNDESKLARSVVQFRLQVSVPNRYETFLRIAVRDVTSNRFGVIEIPTSALTPLAPATYVPAPPGSPKPAPAPASPAGRSSPPQV